VAKLDNDGNILERIEISEVTGATADPRNKRGPRGLALHPSGSHLYVMNRIANTITVIDTSSDSIVAELSAGSHDPTPEVIRQGRGFLYDARLSGNGTMACASCHVDGEMDHLAWNLGDPAGSLQNLTVTQNGFTTTTWPAHPMKGPMTTQTLRGLKGLEPLHWRGDRASFLSFNPAFSSLLGGEPLSDEDMQTYKDFIETIVYHPNPHRNLDDTLPEILAGGDPQAGESFFRNTPFFIPVAGQSIRCVDCHSHPTGVASSSNFRITQVAPLDIVQPIKIPHLRGVYQKIHFDNAPGAESLSGFGLEHDGVRATIAQAHTGPRFVSIQNDATIIGNLTAFLLCFDTGTKPAVGHSVTISQENMSEPSVLEAWGLLETQAAGRRATIDLIAKADFGGLFYDLSSGEYRSDIQAGLTRTRSWIEDRISAGATVTLMGVPRRSGERMGIDRNLDGILDREPPVITLVVVRTGAGEGIDLRWNAEPDQTYTVEYSEVLGSAGWIALATGVTGSQDGTAGFLQPLAVDGPIRFFRIRREDSTGAP
jgi:YVTN family beta-propeller protein